MPARRGGAARLTMLGLKKTPFALVAVAMAILAGAFYFGLIRMARVADNGQRKTEETIVASALKHLRGKISDTLAQNAYWDEAYDRVTQPIDRKWTDDHLGAYLALTAGIPVTAVFGAQAQPVYTFTTAPFQPVASRIGTNASLRTLVDAALLAPGAPPVPSTAFVKIGGHVFIGAAQRIVPNDARIHSTLFRRFVLVNAIPLGESELRRLQSDFHLRGLSWSDARPTDRAFVSVQDARGSPLAYLGWSPATPGVAFAMQAAPYALICFLVISVLQLILLQSWFTAARKLRDESVARTMFLANATHELRTPLNAIIGFSECLTGEMFGPLSPRYKDYAKDIHASGKLLLGIVNEVLDLTRINSGEVAIGPLQLSPALEQPLRMLREYAKADSIEIRFSDETRGTFVNANEKALGQILLNLGSNAVKFSPQGSVVDIALTRAPRVEQVHLTIRDQGSGISAEKLQKIGQPFFRAHNDEKPGSGLGLAIVKALVDRLGGDFSLHSTLGRGTIAIVKFPIATHLERAA